MHYNLRKKHRNYYNPPHSRSAIYTSTMDRIFHKISGYGFQKEY